MKKFNQCVVEGSKTKKAYGHKRKRNDKEHKDQDDDEGPDGQGNNDEDEDEDEDDDEDDDDGKKSPQNKPIFDGQEKKTDKQAVASALRAQTMELERQKEVTEASLEELHKHLDSMSKVMERHATVVHTMHSRLDTFINHMRNSMESLALKVSEQMRSTSTPEDKERQAQIQNEHKILTEQLLINLIVDEKSAKEFYIRMRAGGVPAGRVFEMLKFCYNVDASIIEGLPKLEERVFRQHA